MVIKKIRIVTDSFCGYEVQVWRLWFPFWVQYRGINTHATLNDARRWANGEPKTPSTKIVENYSKFKLKDMFNPPMTNEQRKYFEEFLKERNETKETT